MSFPWQGERVRWGFWRWWRPKRRRIVYWNHPWCLLLIPLFPFLSEQLRDQSWTVDLFPVPVPASDAIIIYTIIYIHFMDFRKEVHGHAWSRSHMLEEQEGKTYDKFDDIEGRSIGTKGRDAKIENASEELFGLILTLRWEIRVHTCATMHRYSPTPHYNFSLRFLTLPYTFFVCGLKGTWLVIL